MIEARSGDEEPEPSAGVSGDSPDLSQAEFESWAREHYELVYRYAFRLSGNQQTAEDLVQQTFLNAWRSRSQLRERSKSKSWLLTIARNQFLKLVRKSSPDLFSQWESETIDLVDSSSGPHDGLRLDIQQMLERLPVESRIVVLMFFFEGRSYKEISAELNLKMGTVMSRLARAKDRLRAMMSDDQASADDE